MNKNVFFVFILFLAFFVLVYLFSAFNNGVKTGNFTVNKSIPSNYEILKTGYFPYQFEGNSSHVYSINGTVKSFNFSIPVFNGSEMVVLAPISYYKGEVLIPLSSSPNETFNFSQYSGGVIVINGSSGNLLWDDMFKNQVMTQPIIYNGVAYIGLGSDFYNPLNNANGVVALNVTDGRVIWTRYLDSEHMPTFLYYNDTLLVNPGLGTPINNSSGDIYFLNATNGKTIKKINVSSQSEMSSFLKVDNNAYFGAANFNLSVKFLNFSEMFKNDFFSVNLENKSINWVDRFNSSFGMQDSSPVFSDGIIATGYTSSIEDAVITLLGLNYTNGRIVWHFTEPEIGNYTSKYIQLPPLTSYAGMIYSDSPTSGMLYVLNSTTGSLLWRFYTGSTSGNVNIINKSVVILNSKGQLYVINLNGSLINRINTGIPSGPENLVQIGTKILVYGNSDKIMSLPLSFLFKN